MGWLNWLAGIGVALAAVVWPRRSAQCEASPWVHSVCSPLVSSSDSALHKQDLIPAMLLLLSVAAWWSGQMGFRGPRWQLVSAVCAAAAIRPVWIGFAVALVQWRRKKRPMLPALEQRQRRRLFPWHSPPAC